MYGTRAWIVNEMDKARGMDARHGDPWGGDSAIAILHWSLGNDFQIGNLIDDYRALVEAAKHVCMEFEGGEITDGSYALLNELVEKFERGAAS